MTESCPHRLDPHHCDGHRCRCQNAVNKGLPWDEVDKGVNNVATAGGDEEVAAAAELPSSLRHLPVFGVVVVVSMVAGIEGKPQLDVVVLSICCYRSHPPE